MLHTPNLDSWFWITARNGADSSVRPRVGDTDFLGREMSDELGERISLGLIHPQKCCSWARLVQKQAEMQQTQFEREQAHMEAAEQRKFAEQQQQQQRPHGLPVSGIKINLGGDFNSVKEKSPPLIQRQTPSAIVNSTTTAPAHVPVHFAQYRSTLLGKNFETMSRRQRRVGNATSRENRLKARPNHQWVQKVDDGATDVGTGTMYAGSAWASDAAPPRSRSQNYSEVPSLPPSRRGSRTTATGARGRSRTSKRMRSVEKPGGPPRSDIRQPVRSLSAASGVRRRGSGIVVDRSRHRSRPVVAVVPTLQARLYADLDACQESHSPVRRKRIGMGGGVAMFQRPRDSVQFVSADGAGEEWRDPWF
jgi:hypothetical protein